MMPSQTAAMLGGLVESSPSWAENASARGVTS